MLGICLSDGRINLNVLEKVCTACLMAISDTWEFLNVSFFTAK